MAPTIRRVNDDDELLGILEPYEPYTTLLVAPIQERGLGRVDKGWLVEDDGAALGALVVSRLCRDRWRAFVYLMAAEAAPLIARQIEATPSFAVHGLEEHVSHVAVHLRRVKEMHATSYYAYQASRDPEVVEFHRLIREEQAARPATRDDLDDLVDLFSSYELDDIPTVPRLREVLKECFDLDRPIMVIERDDQLIGAIRTDCRSKRYAHLCSQTILPEYRGQGLSMQLGALLGAVVNDSGIGMFAVKNTYNPLPPKHELHLGEFWSVDPERLEGEVGLMTGSWGIALIQRRYKIRGAGRIHKLIERIEGPIRRRNVPTPYPVERMPQ